VAKGFLGHGRHDGVRFRLLPHIRFRETPALGNAADGAYGHLRRRFGGEPAVAECDGVGIAGNIEGLTVKWTSLCGRCRSLI